MSRTKKGATLGPGASNNRDSKQSEIEKYLLGQLGDRFKHAKLLEVSEGSYLITMDVRLPVFGKALTLANRDKKSILNQGYLLTQNAQKYTSQRNRVDSNTVEHLSDIHSDAIPSAKNIVYEKHKPAQANLIPAPAAP